MEIWLVGFGLKKGGHYKTPNQGNPRNLPSIFHGLISPSNVGKSDDSRKTWPFSVGLFLGLEITSHTPLAALGFSTFSATWTRLVGPHHVCLKGDIPGTLKLTASLHLKMDGWNTIVSFWGKRPIFRGELSC